MRYVTSNRRMRYFFRAYFKSAAGPKYYIAISRFEHDIFKTCDMTILIQWTSCFFKSYCNGAIRSMLHIAIRGFEQCYITQYNRKSRYNMISPKTLFMLLFCNAPPMFSSFWFFLGICDISDMAPPLFSLNLWISCGFSVISDGYSCFDMFLLL